MLLHVLSIAIPIVAAMAFASGYYFGRSAAAKDFIRLYPNRVKELLEAHDIAFALGRMSAAEEFENLTQQLMEKYKKKFTSITPEIPEFPEDRKG